MTGRIIFGLILIGVGISFFTNIPVFNFIIALIIIAIGIRVLTGRGRSWEDRFDKREVEEDYMNEVFVFSGANKKIHSDNFQGGKVVAVFGGGDFDLSKVKAKGNEIDLELASVFGGIRLRVPQNWSIRSKTASIIGGVDNKTNPVNGKTVTLRLDGVAVFGGIEIYN